jgi:hypothetical protein
LLAPKIRGDPTGYVTITEKGRGSTRNTHSLLHKPAPEEAAGSQHTVNMQALYEGNDPFASFGEVLATMHQN